MARGGRRQGTPGVSYSNRTDLNTAHAPQTGTQTAASGGVRAPAVPQQQVQSSITPDQVPRLDDPSLRPQEPLTSGLDIGPGVDASGLGPLPTNPALLGIQGAYLRNPTPELRRAMIRLTAQGII